jgi:hypothetical protein
MTFYSLYVDPQKHLSTPARDRGEALAVFGKELGLKLTHSGRFRGGCCFISAR